jgi:predicted RNA-binding Zn ribbon-like protein
MTTKHDTPVTLTCQALSPVTHRTIANMPAVPSWYPGTEAKPAPMPLLRVQAFVNTRDLEEESDLLSDVDAASAWLLDAGLLSPDATLSAADLEQAQTVRESIRRLLEPGDGDPRSGAVLGPLRELADTHPLRLWVGDHGMLALENPRHNSLGDGLFDLLLIIRQAQQDGSWPRLKTCANPDCRWAFYDRSRNQQGNWCNMALCGNRLKNRHLRARRR